jgi:hypothetical protein
MLKTVWLSLDVFSWSRMAFGAMLPLSPETRRPFEYLAQAERHLLNGTSDLNRGDAVANIKRALNLRLRQLDAQYRLSRLPLPNRNTGLLQRLEALGLVRPLLLKHLLDVRNRIEHRDTVPPSSRRCHELLDFVWYFLRSTDILADSYCIDGSFHKLADDGDDTPYGFELRISYRAGTPRMKIDGWFSDTELSQQARAGHAPVRLRDYHGPEKWHGQGTHLDKLPTDRWLAGIVVPDAAGHLRVFRILLNPS